MVTIQLPILPWDILETIIAWTSTDIHTLRTLSLVSREVHTECCRYLWRFFKLSPGCHPFACGKGVEDEFLGRAKCITTLERKVHVKHLKISLGDVPSTSSTLFDTLRRTLPSFVNLTTLTLSLDTDGARNEPSRFMHVLDTTAFAPNLIRFHVRHTSLKQLGGFLSHHPLIRHVQFIGHYLPKLQAPLPNMTSLDVHGFILRYFTEGAPVEQVRLSLVNPRIGLTQRLYTLTRSLSPIRRLDVELIPDGSFTEIFSSLPYLLHLIIRCPGDSEWEVDPIRGGWFRALAAHNSIIAFELKQDVMDVQMLGIDFLQWAPRCASLLEVTLSPFGALGQASVRLKRTSCDVFEWNECDARVDSIAYKALPEV